MRLLLVLLGLVASQGAWASCEHHLVAQAWMAGEIANVDKLVARKKITPEERHKIVVELDGNVIVDLHERKVIGEVRFENWIDAFSELFAYARQGPGRTVQVGDRTFLLYESDTGGTPARELVLVDPTNDRNVALIQFAPLFFEDRDELDLMSMETARAYRGLGLQNILVAEMLRESPHIKKFTATLGLVNKLALENALVPGGDINEALRATPLYKAMYVAGIRKMSAKPNLKHKILVYDFEALR